MSWNMTSAEWDRKGEGEPFVGYHNISPALVAVTGWPGIALEEGGTYQCNDKDANGGTK